MNTIGAWIGHFAKTVATAVGAAGGVGLSALGDALGIHLTTAAIVAIVAACAIIAPAAGPRNRPRPGTPAATERSTPSPRPHRQ